MPIFKIGYELFYAGERNIEAQDEDEAEQILLWTDPLDLMTFPQISITDCEETEE